MHFSIYKYTDIIMDMQSKITQSLYYLNYK